MIASDCRITRSPSMSVGTSSCGLSSWIRDRMLFAAVVDEVDRGDFVRQTLEIQRNAHAIGRARTPVAVELHRRWPCRPRPSPCRLAQPGKNQSSFADPRCDACSMAPNMLAPARSNISIRTVSPNLRNGVTGLPPVRESPAYAARPGTTHRGSRPGWRSCRTRRSCRPPAAASSPRARPGRRS